MMSKTSSMPACVAFFNVYKFYSDGEIFGCFAAQVEDKFLPLRIATLTLY